MGSIACPESLRLCCLGTNTNAKLKPEINIVYVVSDLPSWLKAVGYDIDSLVPEVSFSGDIRPTPDPHTPLMPVTSAFECAFNRDMYNFMKISTVPRSRVAHAQDREKIVRSFRPFAFIFGEGVVLSTMEGKVMVEVLDSASEKLALLATTLLNNSEVVDLHFSIHGRDAHFFTKAQLSQAVEDVRELSLRTEDTIEGVNVTVHRYHETSEIMKYVDIRLHSNHTVLNLRYGTTVAHEYDRVLHHAKQRAIENAWKIEKELAETGQESIHQWNKKQKEELLEKGVVSDMEARYLRSVSRHPELADDAKNIKFVPSS